MRGVGEREVLVNKSWRELIGGGAVMLAGTSALSVEAVISGCNEKF